MPTVEFVYERSCPFIRTTRRRLIDAFQAIGFKPQWTEWEIGDPRTPAYLRNFGSPTILVDRQDIAGTPNEESESCCRIYSFVGDQRGVPPLEMIVAALTKMQSGLSAPASTKKTTRFKAYTALLPAIGLAGLPKLTCPACWPAYAGLLESFGVGFVNYTPYLLPLMGVFLLGSVLTLAHRAKQRRGHGPFFLGVAAALAVLVGKFDFDSDTAMWIGISTLVTASIWNSWPTQRGVQGGAYCND